MGGTSSRGRGTTAEPDWKAIAAAWTPPPVSAGYSTGVALTVACAVMMIVILLAIIGGLIGAAVAFYMIVQPGFVAAGAVGRGTLLLWILYLMPGVLTAVLVASLLRPMFTFSRSEHDAGGDLDRKAEPELYAFVENVCDVLGAPRPERITICPEVNAAAGLKGGLFSLVGRPRVFLVIGAPLVATLTRAQLASIIAHEVGHFAQHRTTRLENLAGRITSWFLRAGYAETPGHRLAEAARNDDSLLSNLFGLVVLFLVMLMQLVYRGIAMVGVAVDANVSRQKEFDADAYGAFFAGTDVGIETLEVGESLASAYHSVMMFGLGMFQGRRELPLNAPQVVARFYRGMSLEVREEAARIRHRERTRWNATHPSLRDRTRAMRELNQPGVYFDRRPATTLFVDFPGVARLASYAMFRPILAGDIGLATFVGVRMNRDGRMESRGDDSTPEFGLVTREGGPVTITSAPARERVAELVGFVVPIWRPVFLRLRKIAEVDDHRAIATRVASLTRAVRELVPPAAAAAADYRSAMAEERAYRNAGKVFASGLRVNMDTIGFAPTTGAGCADRADAASRAIAAALDRIDPALDALAQRASAVLSLLGVAGIERRIPDAQVLRARVDLLLAAQAVLRQVFPSVDAVDRDMQQWAMIGSAARHKRDIEPAKVARREIADRIRETLESVRTLAGATIDPTSGEEEEKRRRVHMTNLGHTLIGASPAWRDYDAIASAGGDFVASWHYVHEQVLLELLQIADEVERGVSGSSSAAGKSGARVNPA